MPENIATLGFEFDSKSTHKKLSDLIEKFNDLESKGKSTKKVLKEVFGDELPGVSESLTRINKLNASFKITGENIKGIGKAISGINRSLNNLNLKALNPLPSNVAQNVERNAERLIKSLNKVGSRVQEALTQINIRPINPVSEDAVQRVERMAKALALIKPVTVLKEEQLKKLERIEKILNRINAAKMPSPDAGKMGKAVSHIKAVNDELSVMSIHADAGAVAFNGLTNSLTGRFFIDAIRNVTQLGQELAMIKSIAGEFDTDVIYRGLQAMPSILGKTSKNARAFYEAYSSGIKGTEQEMGDFVKTTSKLAKTIRADVQPTMDAVTTTMNAYGLGVDKAAYVSDIFFSIVKYGKANGQQLATGLGQVVSTAKTAGLSLEELGSSITVLSKIMQSRNAITYLNNMLSKLINPTKAAADAAREHGIELGLAAVQEKGYINVLKELYAVAQKDKAVMLEIFRDARGQRAALQLLGAGYSDLQQQMRNFANSAGQMDAAFQKISGDRYQQMAAIPETFRRISENAGKAAADLLTFGGALDPILQGLNNMTPATLRFAGTLTLAAGIMFGYKAVMLAYVSLQAMMAKNEQILAQRKNAAALADARSVTLAQRMTVIAQKRNSATYQAAAAKRQEAAAAREVAAANLAEQKIALQNLEMQQLEIAANYDEVAQALHLIKVEKQANAVKSAEIALRKANTAAALAETKAKATGAGAIFANMLAPKSSHSSVAQADVVNKAAAAKAAAYNAAAMQKEAIAAGDLATANKLAAEATRQFALREKYTSLALQLKRMRLKAVTYEQKAATLAQKANNVQTKLAVFWNKASAVAVKAGAAAWKGIRVAMIAAGKAMKALASAALPMLLMTAAMEALMWIWEKLDFSDAKAAEALQQNLSKMQEGWDKAAATHAQNVEEVKKEAGEMQNIAEIMMQINNVASLTPSEFDNAAAMAAKLNEYLGKNLVYIDQANQKISVQGDLMGALAKKQQERETALMQQKIIRLQGELKSARNAMDQADDEIADNWFNDSDEELAAQKEARNAYSAKYEELQAAKKEFESFKAQKELEEIDYRLKKSQKVLEIEQKIADFRKQQAMKEMTSEQRIAEYDTMLAAEKENLKKINQEIEKAALNGANVENLLNAQLNAEKKIADLETKRAEETKKIAEAQKKIAEAQKKIDDFRADSVYKQMSLEEKLLHNQQKMQKIRSQFQKEENARNWRAMDDIELRNDKKFHKRAMREYFDKNGFAMHATSDYANTDWDVFGASAVLKLRDAEIHREIQKVFAKYDKKRATAGSLDELKKLDQASFKEAERAETLIREKYRPAYESALQKNAKFIEDYMKFEAELAKKTAEDHNANKPEAASMSVLDRKAKELELLKLQATQMDLIKEKEKEIQELQKKRQDLERKMLENINKLGEKRFSNQVAFARNDYQRMRLWKKDAAYNRQSIATRINLGQIELADEAFWKYYNAMDQQLALQNKLADAERSANTEMVKLIASMDKFKATTVDAVDANSVQSLELQSRRFEKMPEFSAETREQTFAQKREAQLQQILAKWQHTMQNTLQTTRETWQKEDEKWDSLLKSLKENSGSDTEMLDKSLKQINSTLLNGIKVKVQDTLFEAVTIN